MVKENTSGSSRESTIKKRRKTGTSIETDAEVDIYKVSCVCYKFTCLLFV